jgi:hypothetical protein
VGDANQFAVSSPGSRFADLSDEGRRLIAGARRAMWLAALGPCATAAVAAHGRVATPVLALLALVARDARRPLHIQPPGAGVLSRDEERLARALECCAGGFESAAAFCLASLVGRAPSAALQECLWLVHSVLSFRAFAKESAS